MCSRPESQPVIVFIYKWTIIYRLSVEALGFVLASETATARLRSTTQDLVTITNAMWGLIMQFTISYMVCGETKVGSTLSRITLTAN